MTISFPPGPYGAMVSFATWKKFIEASKGSARMKIWLVDYIREHVRDDNDLCDCFKLGFALGHFSTQLSARDLKDFDVTIALTRDMNNVPIVQRHGKPVA
jgi:5-methylcytosine-specific restriction endonuclease McrBC GTP-binding regulatory subunit McrB